MRGPPFALPGTTRISPQALKDFVHGPVTGRYGVGMTGEGENSRSRSSGRSGTLWLALGVSLALGATAALVLAEDLRWLRLATLAALWAALIGGFVAMRYRKQAATTEQSAAQAQEIYELELEREIAARREFELEIETEARQRADDESREEIYALREEVTALRQSLQSLFGGEVLWERVALTAQAARLRAEEPRMVTAREANGGATPQLTGGKAAAGNARQAEMFGYGKPESSAKPARQYEQVQKPAPAEQREQATPAARSSYGPRRVRPVEDSRPAQRPVGHPGGDSRSSMPPARYPAQDSRSSMPAAGYPPQDGRPPQQRPPAYPPPQHGHPARPPMERPAERSMERPARPPAERPTERSMERSAEQPPRRPAAPAEPYTRRVPPVVEQVGIGQAPRSNQPPVSRPEPPVRDTSRTDMRPAQHAGPPPEAQAPPPPSPPLPPQAQGPQNRSGGRRRKPDDEQPWQGFNPPAGEPEPRNGNGVRPHAGAVSNGNPLPPAPTGRRRAPEPPADDGGGSHSEGLSVTELLAAHGAGNVAPRRRRRADD